MSVQLRAVHQNVPTDTNCETLTLNPDILRPEVKLDTLLSRKGRLDIFFMDDPY
jgi:hypothetical protein